MRNQLFLLLLLSLPACAPVLGDDDDSVGDDDDSVGDDDDSVGDDDDSVGDDDDSVGDDDDTPPPYTPALLFGASFGECAGECVRSTNIGEEGEVRYLTSDWDGSVWTERAGTLSASGLEALRGADQAVDRSELDAVYGCPDCNDGGARSISWDLGPVVQGTRYEYGNPPPLLQELDEVLTAIEQEIATCVYGQWFRSIPACDPIDG